LAPVRVRKKVATTKLAAQLATVETLIAALRTLSGKISEIISQKTGPRPTAKDSM
jgi:hypothetical protein